MLSFSPLTSNSERGHRLAEQTIPGAASGHRLLVEQLLELVLELIGLLFPQILDPGAVMPKLGMLHRRLKRLVVETIELEWKE